MDEARRVFQPSASASASATSSSLGSPSPIPLELNENTPSRAVMIALGQWLHWLISTYGAPMGYHVAQFIVVLLMLKLLYHIWCRLRQTK